MRTARVFYLLLSVLQFIFFLKLVEYVRGEEVDSAQISYSTTAVNSTTSDDGEYRGLFYAPKMKKKKMRTWNETSSQTDSMNTNSTNATEKVTEVSLNSDQNQPMFKTKREQYEHEIARLCPACENNQCTSTDPISSGFPVVPVIIAILTGIGWFILFLIFWIFHTKPNKKGHESGGYGESGEENDIFHHFLKPHERSLQSYTGFFHNVLDSIGKLSDLYNSY